ncbi:MAG: outer membrane protein assembly factor BamE [Planctomycetota bacterium]|jgi:outer membrane protein assembly factor BamE (lipoprotein component of BamABCDE complex)|nr:MAG: outer membrane protein assembly factor BamE [Planctomycetota bacterium]
MSLRLTTLNTTLSLVLLTSCTITAPELPTDRDGKQTLTVGVVQKSIRKGMSGAEVAETLGSPNMVTSGPNGSEVWVYDRTFSQVEASAAGGWTFASQDAGVGIRRSTQSTLTVVVKFDADKKVGDVAYHQSKF